VVQQKFATVWQRDREYPGTVFLSIIDIVKYPQTTHFNGRDANHGCCEDQQGRNSDKQGKGGFQLCKWLKVINQGVLNAAIKCKQRSRVYIYQEKNETQYREGGS